MKEIDRILADIKSITEVLDPKGASWAAEEKKRRELSTDRLTALGRGIMEPINRTIQEGDTVDIYFDTVECEFNATILYTPIATGDCFHCKRPDGTLFYVMLFVKMVKKGEIS